MGKRHGHHYGWWFQALKMWKSVGILISNISIYLSIYIYIYTYIYIYIYTYIYIYVFQTTGNQSSINDINAWWVLMLHCQVGLPVGSPGWSIYVGSARSSPHHVPTILHVDINTQRLNPTNMVLSEHTVISLSPLIYHDLSPQIPTDYHNWMVTIFKHSQTQLGLKLHAFILNVLAQPQGLELSREGWGSAQ